MHRRAPGPVGLRLAHAALRGFQRELGVNRHLAAGGLRQLVEAGILDRIRRLTEKRDAISTR